MKIGFIGTGNMGSAIINGILKKDNKNIISIYDIDPNKIRNIKNEFSEDKYNIIENKSLKELCENSDYIFLCVKPQIIKDVVASISNYLEKRHIIVSIAVGVSIKEIKALIDKNIKVVRTMPNTPALVNEGMTIICFDDINNEEIKKDVLKIFNSIGKTQILKEEDIAKVISLTASSPAYIFMLIEAMADGAVLQGLNRKESYEMAAQAIIGSAKMVIETKKHPAKLKDNVCSPGGTTIAALSKLEEKGFRSSIIEAMKKCTKKAYEIQNNKGSY